MPGGLAVTDGGGEPGSPSSPPCYSGQHSMINLHVILQGGTAQLQFIWEKEGMYSTLYCKT